jgi:ABC-type transport system substrate-binding protein
MDDDFKGTTIETRQGAQFHKGYGELTAEDVAWTYNRVNPTITPQSIAPSASYFSTLLGPNEAVATDSNHVKFDFAVVDSHWHSYMMNTNGFVGVVIHSKKAYEENGEDKMKDIFVSTGPYEINIWTMDDRAVLEKTGNHYSKDPEVTKFTILAMPEEATRIAALQTGEIEIAQLGIKSIPALLEDGFASATAGNAYQVGIVFSGNNWEAKHALTGEELGTANSGVYMRDIPWIGNPFSPNTGDDPAELKCAEGVIPLEVDESCGDMEQARLVRHAVGMAVNRDLINETMVAGLGVPVHISYSDETNQYWQEKWEYPYDLAQAEAFLDKAGYPRKDGGDRFEMPLFTNTGQYSGLGEEIADALSGMMSEIGIKTQVLKYPYAVFRPSLVGRTATVPRITSGDDGQSAFPFDWPKGIEESSLSRGGYCECFETEWISQIYLDVSKEPDLDKRIELSSRYFDLMHFWAIKPGVVSIPALTTINPEVVKEWKMEPSFMMATGIANIKLGN